MVTGPSMGLIRNSVYWIDVRTYLWIDNKSWFIFNCSNCSTRSVSRLSIGWSFELSRANWERVWWSITTSGTCSSGASTILTFGSLYLVIVIVSDSYSPMIFFLFLLEQVAHQINEWLFKVVIALRWKIIILHALCKQRIDVRIQDNFQIRLIVPFREVSLCP